MKSLAAAGCLVMLLAPSLPAAAASDLESFRTPSNNIFCMASNFDTPVLRCDMREITSAVPPRPRSCDLEWGDAFEITQGGSAGQRLCHGDTVMEPNAPVLDYGRVWQGFGFTCRSEPSGLSCFNARMHGFTLSRASQRLF